MTIETATTLYELNANLPADADEQAEGDDHIRLIKKLIKDTFPGFGGVFSRTVSKSSAFTPGLLENTVLFNCTGSPTVTLLALASLSDGTHYFFFANGGTVTLDGNGTELINGLATLVLSAGRWCMLAKNGSSWLAFVSRANTTVLIGEGGTGQTTRAAAVAALGLEAAEISVATAAGATTDIGAAAGTNILLTTTATTITGFASAAAGVWRKVRVATGGITLTHSSTFVLPQAVNIVAAAGDVFDAYSTGSGWIVREYSRASGRAAVEDSLATLLEITTGTETAARKVTPALLKSAIAAISPPASNVGAALFTASGSFTVPSGVTSVVVTVVGGGGGAGDSSSTIEGGAGGYGGAVRACISGLTPGASITVTVGGGGAAGVGANTYGGAGGTSSFGTYITCTGGGGGKGSGLSTPRGGANGTYSVPSGSVVEGFLECGGGSRLTSGGTAALDYSITGSDRAGSRGTTNKDESSYGGVGGRVLIEW